jgi:SSS family solute:Na+ symporter
MEERRGGKQLMILAVIVLYFVILIVLGYFSSLRAKKTPEDFFVAGRTFNTFILAMILLATVMSTFVFMAGPGLVYTTGMGFVGGFFVGNFLFTIFIYFIGRKIWYFGKKYGFITPSELFADRFESNVVKYVIFIAMVIFVLPYLALQPIGGGLLLNVISGGSIPYIWGALLITLITIIYVWMSGQRAVAWNDVFQGLLLLTIFLGLVFWMTAEAGGSEALLREAPELIRRGEGTAWIWQASFSWMVIVALNLIMQPQIFTRYYTGRSMDAVRRVFVIWPFLSILSCVPMAYIGAYGKVLFPNLQQPDQIVPVFVMEYAPSILVGLVAAGLLAALMSTSSGQILALSSMFTHDLYRDFKKDVSERHEFNVGRIMVVILAIGGFLIGINPPALMGTLAQLAFSGIAVLTPAAMAAFYWKRATAAGVVTSIILGELVILLSPYTPFIQTISFGFQPVIPAVILSIVSLWIVSLFTEAPSEEKISKYFEPERIHQLSNQSS